MPQLLEQRMQAVLCHSWVGSLAVVVVVVAAVALRSSMVVVPRWLFFKRIANALQKFASFGLVKIVVDSQKCQGHNRCFALAPDLVEVDEFGYATAIGDGEVPADLAEQAHLAEANCPEFAITLETGTLETGTQENGTRE